MQPHIWLYRVGNFCHRSRIPFLPAVFTWLNRLCFSCIIPSSAQIGRDVRIGYWGLGVVIHKHAQIGDRCWIMQNVTLGRKAGVESPPKLDENVAVGAGAVILGDITVGANSVIGANSVVVHSVPANVVVAGVPAKPIRSLSEGSTHCHYEER